MLYRLLVRPWLYLLPPEPAHLSVMALLRCVGRGGLRRLLPAPAPRSRLALTLWGVDFPNPIGLAAGFDKDGEAYGALSRLGFGAIEVGTLTAQAQPGNPRPRMFRLPRDRALINRMGFNNCGAEAAAGHLARERQRTVPLGINIGKTKAVALEDALDDYATSTRWLSPLADYLVVNVSSPNTPGLRDLQAVSQLRPLLQRIQEEISATAARNVPLLVKIAPDLAPEDVDAVADLCVELGLAGIIATNTTIARDGLLTAPEEVARCGAGGLSGPVLRERSLALLRRLYGRVGSRLAVISVGGIETVDDVWGRLAAGASLVQLYTSFIYSGPALPRTLARQLERRLEQAGFASVSELIGSECAAQRQAGNQHLSHEAKE